MPDFVGGPVRRHKKGKNKYLVMWKARILDDGSISKDKILVFAGGMEHPAEHGDLEATFIEELKEETGLQIRESSKISRFPVIAEHNGHNKNFVAVWRRDCDGTLRKKGIPDGTSWLYPPRFEDKQFLKQHLHGDYRLILPFLED